MFLFVSNNHQWKLQDIIVIQICQSRPFEGYKHKVLTYIEYRAVSGVFRPGGGRTHSLGGQYFGRRQTHSLEVNISEDARHWIGLLQYNPSMGTSHRDRGDWLPHRVFSTLMCFFGDILKGTVAWDGFLAYPIPYSVDRKKLWNFFDLYYY